jgi:hypothetical protein
VGAGAGAGVLQRCAEEALLSLLSDAEGGARYTGELLVSGDAGTRNGSAHLVFPLLRRCDRRRFRVVVVR